MTAVAERPVTTPRLPGLAWVTWRLHRGAIAGVAGVLGALSLVMLVIGLRMHHDYTALKVAACIHSASCEAPYQIFRDRYSTWTQLFPQYLTFVPVLIGVFVGGPLVAREYESGTFRFAWTQGTSRVRWIVAKLVLLAAVLVVLSLAFSWVFTWWYGPWNTLTGRVQPGGAYETEGLMFAARVVYAFALGALLGLVLRRPLVAMATAGVVWAATVFASVLWLRPLIVSPVTISSATYEHTAGGWLISTWHEDPQGHHVSDAAQQAVAEAAKVPSMQIPQWLREHGYTSWASMHPESQFWHLQLVESVIYLLVSVALGGAAVWLLRRRAA